MSDVIAGRQAIVEALKSDTALEKIVLLHGVHGTSVQQICRLARQRGIPVVEVGKERFRELAGVGAVQGVLAIAAARRYVTTDELLDAPRKRGADPFLLILDGIEDPYNLGALIRTAECAGVHGVVIPKHHASPVTQTAIKASAGAALHLPVARVTNIAQTLDELRKEGIWIVGTDERAGRAYFESNLKGPLAIVIGSEGKGIRRLVKEKCDELVRIPVFGSITSLNASVAGALVLFEAARMRTKGGDGRL